MTTHTLTIIKKPGGETESIEFPSSGAAMTYWTNRAYELTSKGWTYQQDMPEEALSMFARKNESLTVYLSDK